MIRSQHVSLSRPISRQILAAPMSPDSITIGTNWRVKNGVQLPPKGRYRLTRHIKIFTGERGASIRRIACDSLPALLFGHNGRLIVNQKEYDDAIARLTADLSAVADVPPIEEWKVLRLDIGWNFDLRARPIIMTHEFLRIPGIRKAPSMFDDGDGISWRGADSRFVVRFYDKARQMHCPDSILRAEISLCGKHLARHFKESEWMNINALWRVFRGIMATIPQVKAPVRAKNWRTSLGMLPRELRTELLANLEPCTSRRTFRRWRAEVEAAARTAKADAFSWSDLLKPDGPPPPVHVNPPSRKRQR